MPHRARILLSLVALGACRAPDALSLPDDTTSLPTRTHLMVRSFPGATLEARLRAALGALPPAGGVVDASDIAGEHLVLRTIQVGSRTMPVDLRLGSLTLRGKVPVFRLSGRVSVTGNDQTLITQDSAANLRAIIETDGVTGCELSGLTVDGNRSQNSAPGGAIAMRRAVGCHLHHLTVQNTVGHHHPAIAFYGDGHRDNTIEHNLIQNIGTRVEYADGIYVYGPGNKVLFNRIRRATDFAIVGELCSGCVVHGNDIEDSPAGIAVGSGIASGRADGNIVEGNTIRGGLTSHWGVITVYRTMGVSPVGTIVRGNVVRDVEEGAGIMVNGATQVSLDGNLLSNIAPDREGYGIHIKDSQDVSVRGGAIDNTGSFGVGIGNSANVRLDGLMVIDAARSGNGAPGIGFDVRGLKSTSISLTRLTIFDRATDRRAKRMPWCIDFGQGGSTEGVLIADVLFDDGVNATGCRDGAVNLTGASRVTMPVPPITDVAGLAPGPGYGAHQGLTTFVIRGGRAHAGPSTRSRRGRH